MLQQFLCYVYKNLMHAFCFQCREATLNLFRSERSLKKKQLLDELTKRGLTDDIKVVTAILKVHTYRTLLLALT